MNLRFGNPECDRCGQRHPIGQDCAADEPFPEPRRTLSDGTQIYPEHRRLKPDGQQEGYVVLAEEERAKGFVRPLRHKYRHLKCGAVTTIDSKTIVETLARDPHFYSGTFCCSCGRHFTFGQPDGDFVWDGTDEKLGT